MERIKFSPIGKTNEEKYMNIWDSVYNGRTILIRITNCAKKGIYVIELEGTPCSCNRSLNFEYYYRNYSHDTVAILPEDLGDPDITFWEEIE